MIQTIERQSPCGRTVSLGYEDYVRSGYPRKGDPTVDVWNVNCECGQVHTWIGDIRYRRENGGIGWHTRRRFTSVSLIHQPREGATP